jgi:gliding motility-associated-like protein
MKSRYFIFLLLLIVNLGYASSTTKPFALSATITGGTTVCQNSTQPLVTFTGSGGTAPYTFVYQINGTNQPAFTTTIAGEAVTIQAPTAIAGSFIYTLVSVQDSSIPVTPIPISGSTTVVVNTPHTVDFTFTNDSTCSGTVMQFAPIVSGVGSATYSWDFGDGTPISSISNPSHNFTASLGCGNQNFTVNLTVTKNGCTIIKSHTITVKQKPNISFTDVLNQFNQFNNCNNAATNPVYTIKVGNTSQSSCISTFSVNWGDGIIEDDITFPKTHTYATNGVYSMVITALGANGCNNSKTYTVKNVSNPLGGLNSPGSTQNLCTPTANLQFSISSWGTNSLDTTYNIDYGDGSTLVLTQSQLNSSTYYNIGNPAGSTNYPIPHIYTTSSCPLPSFELKLNITNACSTTPIVLGNISTLTRPIANFNIPNKACVATPVLFTNTTIAGYNLSCDQNSIYEWDFGDGSPIVTTGLGTNQNISHSYLLPGSYSATLTVTGYCGPTSITKIICIEPAISASFNLNTTEGCAPLAVTTTNTTNLTAQCTTPTYQWTVSYTAGNCGTSAGYSFTNGTSASSANPSFNFTEAGTYTLSLKTTNSCGSTTVSKAVIVKKPPTASINAISTFCNSATITPTAVINSCAPASSTLTYAWSFPGGTPATASSVSPGSISYAVPGNKTISLLVTNECGVSATATQTFTVNPTPTITNTIITQTVCSGTSSLPVLINAEPSGATFSWTATATVGISGFIPSGVTSTIPAQTLTTTSATSGTVTYVVKPKIGTCEGASFTYTITVIPAPKIITQPLVSSKVCLNGSTPPLTVSISPTAIVPTYQWYSSGTNTTIGGTLIDGANTATYSPLTNTVGTVYYYCVITLSSGGCPNLTSATGAVEVVALPLVTAQPIASQILCVGGTLATPLQVVYTSSTGVPTFQWYRNTVNSTTSGTAIPGATSATYTPPIFTVQGSYYYYLIMTFNGSGCGTVTSTAAEIIVTPDPSITLQPLVSQTLCSNATPTALFVAATGGNGSFIYQWFRNTSNNTTGGVLISGATSATYSPPTGIVGITFYYCVITQSSLGCSVTSETAQVIIKQSPTASILPISSTSCIGGTPNTLTVSIVNCVGTPTYKWYSNIANNATSGSAIAGQTSSTFTPPSDSAGTTFYYCLVTFDAITGSCSTVATNTSKVEIIPAAVVSILPIAPLNLCVGVTISSPLAVSYTGGTGNPTYKWFSNTTNSNTGGTLISGANTANYTPPTFNTAGTFYFYAQVSLSGSGCGAVSSSVVEIIVSEDPTISSQPIAVQTLCSNAIPTDLVVAAIGGNGSFNYQWYSNTLNSTTGGTLLTGATSASYTPPTGAVGTTFYYCLITQSTLGCNVTSAISKVIINASPVASILPISSTSCIGGSPTVLTLTITNGVGTPTYQWYSNSANNTTSGSAIAGQTSSTFTPPSDTAGTTFYYCLVTFDAITGSCSTVATNTSKVEIIPAAVVSILPIAPLNLCVAVTISSPLSVSYTGGTGNPTYKWFSNTTNSNTGGTLIFGANTASYTPPTFNTAGTFYFYAQVSLSGSGCGAVSSSVVAIIVSEDPTISSQPIAVQTLCSNATPTDLVVATTGGNGTFIYQWYSNTINSTSGGTLIAGATSTTYTPITSFLGTVYYYCIITQSTLGCNATSNTATIIVNASPSASITPTSAIACLGGTLPELSITTLNGAGAATYQWYYNTINNTSTGTAIPFAVNATFTPPSNVVGVLYYFCSVTFAGIEGSCATVQTNTTEITITPALSISQNPLVTQSLCVGVTIANPLTVSFNGGTGIASYQWYSNNSNDTSTGTEIPGANEANYTPPVFNSAGTFYFYAKISLSGIGCGAIYSNTAKIIVVIDPIITLQPIVIQTLCQNATPTTLSVIASGGIGTLYNYQWYSSTTNSNNGGILLSGQNSSTYVPLTNSTGTMFYYCIVTQEIGSGCNVTSETAQVIVNTAPAINLNPQPNAYCVNQVATPLTVGYLNGTGTPIYQWFSNVTNTNSGGILVPGQTNSSFTPPTNTAGNIYYYCTITFPSLVGGCEIITSTTALITVNNFPIITSEIQTICSTNAFLITPLNGSGNIVPVGTSYIWSQPIINPAGALIGFSAQTTPQSEISQILNNTTTSPATATYTITPNSGDCVGPDFTVTITVNPLINPNVIVNNNACFGVNNASISTNITGGIAPYTITWTGPNGFTSSATTISNIETGTYMLTIDDIGNCPFTNSYTITQPDDIVILTNSQTNSTCFGSNNGTIDLSITGGTGSYSYAWTKNNIAFATTQDLSNLSPGTYTATVSDENNCGPKTITFTVTEPPLLVVTLVNKTNIDCFGTSTGAINIQVVGGTIAVDYNFYWTGPNGFTSTSKNLTSLFSGTYNLTVTDDNGCQKTLQVILTQSPEIIISFTTTEITCYGANNASLTTTIVGGSAPYSFVWDNLATSLNQDNLAAGNYTITVNDNLGCIKLATVNIPEAPIFTINPVVKNVSCFGANNGSINLNLVGGIAPVSLSWSDGSTAGLTRNNLAPGTYTATITDGKPCVIVRTFIIIQPQTLVLSANLVNPTNCNNANSGAIDLIVSGGTPPFSYSWSNGTTNEDLINAIAGSYSVTVLDKNGCSASAQYTLIRPEPITISVTTQTDFNCTTHQVKQNFVAQASGGVPPFTYQWSSGNISGNNNQIMNTDTNGIVILTVFDSLGCSQIYTVNVDNPEIGYATFEPTSVSYTSFSLFSINDPIQFTSTITGDYESLFWDFGDGTFSSELNPLHTFLIPKDYVVTQTVTYPFGCVYKHVITLTVEKGYLLVLPTGFTPNNDSLNDKYRPVAKGLKNITMDIYDSWGSIIYSEKGDVIKGWDGKIKGFDAENGNYYSKVAGETFYGTTVYESQTIVLIK